MGKGNKISEFNATRREEGIDDVADQLPDMLPVTGVQDGRTERHRSVKAAVRQVLETPGPMPAEPVGLNFAPAGNISEIDTLKAPALRNDATLDPRRATRIEARKATVERITKETQIVCSVDLDGVGHTQIDCEIGFFAHMLEALGRHAHIDLQMRIRGDLHIDQHHTVEDTALVLGQAIRKALGDRRGIWRSATMRFPMDETLAECSIDIAGRPHLVFAAQFGREKIGDLHTDLVVEFFAALTHSLGCNLHLELIRGHNDHHKCEALFKAFARALELAVAIHPRASQEVPSTKGSLDG